jgi:hypothetical protein
MPLIITEQANEIIDPVGAIAAMVIPILEATVKSARGSHLESLKCGEAGVTLDHLSFVFREGDGHVGICFEYAVHEGIATRNRFIYPIALEKFCNLRGDVESILFGAEKRGFAGLLESANDLLTDDARVLTGSPGPPLLLKKRLENIQRAFRDPVAQKALPPSIGGIHKADLFLGTRENNRWVAATVKLNPYDVSRHPGLRVAIHPQGRGYDLCREEDGLIRIPLPYDFAFMEYFREAVDVVRALLRSRPDQVIDSAARYVARKLHPLRQRPVREVVNYLREGFADQRLLKSPHLVCPQKVTFDRDIIRRFLPGLFPKPAIDKFDASDSPRSIGPVPLAA